MASAPTPYGSPPPPGWYPDPGGQGQRYWDGRQWTQHLGPGAPPVQPSAEEKATAVEWIGLPLLSLLIPVVGFIFGALFVAKTGTKRTVGIVCLAIAAVRMVIFFAAGPY